MPIPFFHPRKKSHKSLNVLLTQICSQPRCYISVALLLTVPLIISVTQPYFSNSITAVISNSVNCTSRTIYVYDLPSIFNDDWILHNCTDNNPYDIDCGIAADHGLGYPATELRHVVPDYFSSSWFRTNQFSLEILFHGLILDYRCRTLDPESATAFYIPFYAGLALEKHIVDDFSIRDHPGDMLISWLQQQKYWNRFNGSDHFISIGRPTFDFRRLGDLQQKWGSKFLNMPEMKSVTRFILEGLRWDDRDVSVPYPTGFHPQTGETLKKWQDFVRLQNRTTLSTFVGSKRPWVENDFRTLLLNYCSAEPPESCHAVDCAAAHCVEDVSHAMEALLGSEFCFQPVGDTATRRSIFDCILAGSVPVFFWETQGQYKWFLPDKSESYSVFINDEEVRNRSSLIKETLGRYSKEKIRVMREKVIEIIPRIVYGIDNGGSRDFEDAFDIAINGVLERIHTELNVTNT